MKHFIYILIFLFLTDFLKSQTYYRSNDTIIPVSSDRSTIIFEFNENSIYKNTPERYSAHPSILKSTITPDHKRTIIIYDQEQIKPLPDLLSEIGLYPLDLTFFSYGYKYNDGTRFWPTKNIILKFRSGNDLNSIDDFLQQYNLNYVRTDFDMVVLEIRNIDSVLSAANSIHESGIVLWCHPDFIAEIILDSDPLYPYQYYLNNTGQTGGTNNIDINAPEAWAVTLGISDIVIAVIDQGCETHEDLQDNLGNSRVLQGFTPKDPTGYGVPTIADQAHGMACAGIIAATNNNGLGIKGILPTAKILPINIFYGGETTQDIANAINWAWQNGADVLSNSWGYSGSTTWYQNIADAISNARIYGRNGKGCVVVFAAGNTGGTGCDCVTFPAKIPGVINVGAVDKNGNKWYYSPHWVDVVAPSGDVNLQGDVYSLDRMGSLGYNSGNYMSNFGGTSAACPQVAGIAALMLSDNPNLYEYQVACRIRSNSSNQPLHYNSSTGNGIVNASASVNTPIDNITFPFVVTNPPVTIYTFAFESTNHITLGNNLLIDNGADITLRAGKIITAKLGSKAKSGSKFHAYIGFYTCGANGEIHKENDSLLLNSKDSLSISNPLSLPQYIWKIYPNPSNGSFTIFSENLLNEAAIIYVYNSLGEKIQYHKTIFNRIIIDLSSQPRGIYFLKVQTADPAGNGAGKIYTEKIILQ